MADGVYFRSSQSVLYPRIISRFPFTAWAPSRPHVVYTPSRPDRRLCSFQRSTFQVIVSDLSPLLKSCWNAIIARHGNEWVTHGDIGQPVWVNLCPISTSAFQISKWQYRRSEKLEGLRYLLLHSDQLGTCITSLLSRRFNPTYSECAVSVHIIPMIGNMFTDRYQKECTWLWKRTRRSVHDSMEVY